MQKAGVCQSHFGAVFFKASVTMYSLFSPTVTSDAADTAAACSSAQRKGAGSEVFRAEMEKMADKRETIPLQQQKWVSA